MISLFTKPYCSISDSYRKFKFVFIIITVITFSSCNNSNNKVIPSIKIKPNVKNIEIRISRIINFMDVIALETNQQCLISSSLNLIHLDDSYIIIKSGNQILVFDRKGKYVSKVDAFGNGPQEYSNTLISLVLPLEKQIYIVNNKKLNVYSYSGEYIKSFYLPVRAGGGIMNENGQMLIPLIQFYNDSNRDMLYLLNKDLSVKYIFKSRNPDVLPDIRQDYLFYGNPYSIGSNLFYREAFCDTIFKIVDTVLIPHWHINMGKYKPLTKEGINIGYKDNSKDKIFNIIVKETENYFFIEYYYNLAIYMSVYEKKSESYIFHQKYSIDKFPMGEEPILGIDNDILKDSPPFWPKFILKKFAVCIINPVQLSDEMRRKIGCEIDENPILFIGELR